MQHGMVWALKKHSVFRYRVKTKLVIVQEGEKQWALSMKHDMNQLGKFSQQSLLFIYMLMSL